MLLKNSAACELYQIIYSVQCVALNPIPQCESVTACNDSDQGGIAVRSKCSEKVIFLHKKV